MNNQTLRQGLAETLSRLEFEYFVTLTTNLDDVTDDTAAMDRRVARLRRSLTDWEARVDRTLLGPKWLKKKQDLGIFAAYTVENIDTNVHAHLLMKVRCPHDPSQLGSIVDNAWRRIWPYGTTATDEIYRIDGAVAYVTKAINKSRNWDAFDFIGPLPAPEEGSPVCNATGTASISNG